MRPRRCCFITATDTDAGKSFLTALLLRDLRRRNANALALKPVACGVGEDGVNPDVALLRALQPGAPAINLHTAPQPMAPIFSDPVERDSLLLWCRRQCARQEITLIEGVGGLMVPLAAGFTQLDWITGMGEITLILVVRARLGCLSQVLTHLALLDHLDHHRIWLVINAVTEAERPFAEQCAEVVDQWHPWVRRALLAPRAEACPALTDWLCQRAPTRDTL